MPTPRRVVPTEDTGLFIAESDTVQLIDVDTALEAVRQVARWEAEGAVVTPTPATSVMKVAPFNARYRVKMACLTELPVVGIRIIGYPLGASEQTSTRFVLLSDPVTGTPLALVDDHWAYQLRTAASAALGMSYAMASTSVTTLGIVGAGRLADAMLVVASKLFEVGRVLITSRRPETREALARKATEQYGLDAVPVASVEEAVRPADVVVTATNANRPLVKGEWLAPGVVLCTLGRYELEVDGYRMIDTILVDSWKVAQDSPDIKELVAAGHLSQERIHAQFHELISGAKGGRSSANERILVRSDGLVSQDIALAYQTYLLATQRSIGTVLPGAWS